MPNEPKIEIRNMETVFGGTVRNTDLSPVQEVVQDGKPVQEIHNKEEIGGTVKNRDGTPVKVIKAVP